MADQKQQVTKGKRNSARQKAHYKAHPAKILRNKLRRLRAHIRRNDYDVARKARRKPGRTIGVDKQAVNALKRLGG